MFAVHSLEGWLINMSNPYKTRAGGATVTVFVPYDCNNHCPFCINKQEYEDCTGFSLEAILRSIRTMDEITPACDFVFTGGEPLAQPRCPAADAGRHPAYAQDLYQHDLPGAAAALPPRR